MQNIPRNHPSVSQIDCNAVTIVLGYVIDILAQASSYRRSSTQTSTLLELSASRSSTRRRLGNQQSRSNRYFSAFRISSTTPIRSPQHRLKRTTCLSGIERNTRGASNRSCARMRLHRQPWWRVWFPLDAGAAGVVRGLWGSIYGVKGYHWRWAPKRTEFMW